MKKIILNVIFVGLISILALPLCVSAKSISTLETSTTNGKITVSGTTENGVLAIAALVYTGDDLVYMETCEANGTSYSCILNNTFAKGDYIVKVADYDGGAYVTDNISITNSAIENNPKTSDNIVLYFVLSAISFILLIGLFIYIKSNKKHKISHS